MDIIFVLLGFLIGTLVGMTGMGGGALMTPALIFFGIPASVAVGTDLLYATATKALSSLLHMRRRNIDQRLVGSLLGGSIPGSVLGGYLIGFGGGAFGEDLLNKYTSLALGVVLVIISILMLIRVVRGEEFHAREPHSVSLPSVWKLITVGVTVGFLVQFTSVGSGTLVLFFLLGFTALSPKRIVGTDLFHGFLLTTIGSLTHLWFGYVDYGIALLLIAGTIPGAYMGVSLNSRIPLAPLRVVLILVLMLAGIVLLGEWLGVLLSP
ncbi:sulfite exporter TauE/SafE family protein [Methermicoccus shengliensis]|uniref:Probable membrane transporter protein n=1 Tax=Methermicoccus shengliensis TaxID=660064 RepID=A0A832RXA8_9EURY|nr:sulfite exporter TauE/SafE family protein [Methermicoccus shengliensis]KUK04557.1 MAG: hypothetical protein XD46_0668 [Euryarchaeota archaeon 55_53]KUK29621.1 MAG: hypothetical protein XD62_1303 [Methanosarcinales archeaon 56_1174]MDI3487759.1 uncharacterized protein [Methanosarcinales archaeon]MDN5294885.1 uncharacterized protein [Methanosarcinales archaeon]HIH70076.1 sulfite exporter TauE/SafE family protein [Methermicoccus shengliensis]